MLCISAALVVARRLSVRHTSVSYHQTFPRLGSPIILVFESKRRYTIPRELP